MYISIPEMHGSKLRWNKPRNAKDSWVYDGAFSMKTRTLDKWCEMSIPF